MKKIFISPFEIWVLNWKANLNSHLKCRERGKERNMLDILIVEDNKEIGNLLCDFLRKENYTVIVLYLSNFTTDILGMHWRMMNF